jgi:hypothetical protein
MRRAAGEIARRDVPLNCMLIPTSVPITHSVLDGHVFQIMTARIRVTMPSNSSHPEPGSGRNASPKTTSTVSKNR